MNEPEALDVYLHGGVVGTLERRSQARLRFTYGEEWVAEERQPLSLSLPVRPEPYDHEKCAPYFEGLLPEGEFLKAIARTLHISAANPFQLLTELGGECAGAVSVGPAGGPEPGRDPRPPRWLSTEELGALLAALPERPLVAAIDEVEDGGFRLSLAGAQTKVGVLARDGEVGLSHGKPPTTEILKAPIPHVEESVVNEAFCMSLAAHADLDVAAAHPRLAGSQEYLLVHRYDRDREMLDGRIHQEDFCQALGLVPAVKYEREGGPGVAACAALLRRSTGAPARDIAAFLDALLFNFVVANHDAHSKNYSLLLDGPGSIRLAPLYDLLCTAVFRGSDRKMAMRFGGENRPAYLRRRHLDRLAAELGVKPALVRRRAIAMRERVETAIEVTRRSLPAEFQEHPIVDRMVAVIAERGATLTERATEPGAVAREALVRARSERGPIVTELREAFDRLHGDLSSLSDFLLSAEEDLAALEEPATVESTGAAERLATELETPARGLKVHGRQLYDAVVDLDLAVEGMIALVDVEEDSGPSRLDLLAGLTELGEVAESGIDALEDIYSGVAEIEQLSPALRAPARNIRSGLRDSKEARGIIREWGRRAAAARRR